MSQSLSLLVVANSSWWVDDAPFCFDGALTRFLEYFRLLCSIFKLGLISYSGSHSCPFNETIFNQGCPTTFQYGEIYTLRQKRLRCLDEFIDGPVWIFEKAYVPDDGYALSLTIQEFARLWGPVWAVPCAPDQGQKQISLVRTEGGVIQGFGWTDKHEVYCHWTPASLGEFNRPSDPIPFSATSPILLGAHFYTNANCQKDIEGAQNDLACLFSFPGVSKDYFELDALSIQVAGGYMITAGTSMSVRRRPGTRLKSRIVEYCRNPNVDLGPILRLRVGLEVSVCTGNAQRISLWEALRLASVFCGSTSGIPSRISGVTTCSHQIGDILCVQECWVRSDGTSAITNNMDARACILTALSNLQFTGLDNHNALHLWWPFTQEPNTLPIKETPTGKHNWIHMLRDSRDSATFAVMSPRCLEYEDISMDNKLKIWRRCLGSRENQTMLLNLEGNGVITTDRDRTLLYTTLQLHPTPCHPKKPAYNGPESGQTIDTISTHTNQPAFDKSITCVGSQVEIDGIGTLQVINEEHPPLTKLLRKKFNVLEKMTNHLSKGDKRQKYRELISGEKVVGPTMNVIVM